MTIEEHADAIMAAFEQHRYAIGRRAAILAAVRAVYEDGRETALRAQIDAKMEQQP